jgi:hypothetical protein
VSALRDTVLSFERLERIAFLDRPVVANDTIHHGSINLVFSLLNSYCHSHFRARVIKTHNRSQNEHIGSFFDRWPMDIIVGGNSVGNGSRCGVLVKYE